MATAAYNLCLDYLRWLCRVPMFVGEWIPNARLTSCSWVNGVIYLLGDVVEDSIHHTCRWAYLGAKVLLMCFFPKIMAFADITTLCQGILGVLLQSCLCSIFNFSRQSYSLLCCACVSLKFLFAVVCPTVILGVATVVWFYAADTLPLPLFFDGCFTIIAT